MATHFADVPRENEQGVLRPPYQRTAIIGGVLLIGAEASSRG